LHSNKPRETSSIDERVDRGPALVGSSLKADAEFQASEHGYTAQRPAIATIKSGRRYVAIRHKDVP
jgi:hypothetical protein